MLAASAGATTAGASAAGPVKPQYFELQWFYLRNGSQPKRVSDFFEQSYAPALTRLGLPPFGFFQPVIGEGSPFWLVLATLPTLETLESTRARLASDHEYQQALTAFLTGGEPPYIRREISLLRAFPGMPALLAPPPHPKQSRIFELRTYESNTSATLQRKIQMFESGEIGIFQRLGMAPVFFGETIIGRNLPSLTYMLTYGDLAARDRLWTAFGADAQWQKMRAGPGNSDAEIVSNISNMILRPAPFSQVR